MQTQSTERSQKTALPLSSDNSDESKAFDQALADAKKARSGGDQSLQSKSTEPSKTKADTKDNKGPESESEFRDKAAKKGWKVVEDDDVLPPTSRLEPTRVDASTITYTYDGKTYAVSQHISPFKYSVVSGKLAGEAISHEDNNIQVDVPDSSATDIMNAETTEDGKTVTELFNSNMKDAWGDLDLDDKRRQYYELVRAKSALTAGYQFIPNETERGAFGHSDTTGTLKDSVVVMDTASTYGLLDEKAVSEKLGKLADDPEIMKGVDGFMQKAVDKIDNKDELADRVYKAMSSDDYKSMLETTDRDGAKARFANDIKTLDYLAPKKAQKIRDDVLDQGIGQALNDKIASGDFSDDAIETAATDQVKVALQSTWSSIFGIAFTDRTVQNYLKKGTGDLPEDVKRGLDSYKEAIKHLPEALVGAVKNGKVDIKKVAANIADFTKGNKNVPVHLKQGVAALTSVALSNGTLPAAAGGLTAFAAAYDLSKSKGETTEDRMAAARELLITAATTPALAETLAKGGDKFNELRGALDKPGMKTLLGLQSDNKALRNGFLKLFPKADDAVSRPPSVHSLETLDQQRAAISGSQLPELDLNPNWADEVTQQLNDIAGGDIQFNRQVNAQQLDDVIENANDRIDQARDAQGENFAEAYNEMSADERARVGDMLDDRASQRGIDVEGLDTKSKLRLVGPTLNVVGGLSDTAGGLLDVALGAMSLDHLANDPDALPAEKASASLQLLSGVSIAGQAGTNIAAMVAGESAAAALGVASGALGIVGVGLGVIGLIVAGVIAKQKEEKAIKNTQHDFEDWRTLGVAVEDWGDKLNYVQNATYEYDYEKHHGSDRYNDIYAPDKPMWEARPDQYKDFTDYLNDHSSLSDNWFDNWDDDHPDKAFPSEDVPDPSGLPRLGDDGNAGNFGDFKTDIDRVDVGSIDIAKDGRVFFNKDGIRYVVDPLVGNHLSKDSREKIVDYLKDLHDIVRPNGKLDQDLVDKTNDILGKTDDYNDIDDLKRYLNPNEPMLLGKDGHDAGTFFDFKEDIDRVDVGSIELDQGDTDSITFIKDGTRWKLDKDNNGGLSDHDADQIFDYLKNLYTIVHPDGNLDKDLAKRINDLQHQTDDYNDLDDLRDKLDLNDDPSGLPLFAADGKPGTFGDFKEDIDRVDLSDIDVLDDGRVIFTKDGVRQVINTSDGDRTSDHTREKIIDYLKELNRLAHPEGDYDQTRVDQMTRILGRTDHYNDVDDLRDYLDTPKPAAADEDPHDVTVFNGTGTIYDFREDLDKIDVASIRKHGDDGYYFKKEGRWYELSPDDKFHNYDRFADYLDGLYSITHDGNGPLDEHLARQIDDLVGGTDKYNDIDRLKSHFGLG